MKAFLWHIIEHVSAEYHHEGSVLIVASSLERAREIGRMENEKMELAKLPDAEFESFSDEEKVWVFPNAGCC